MLKNGASAADAAADGHERAESAARLHHRLAHLAHEFPSSQTHPDAGESPEQPSSDYTHSEAHHESQLDSVETRGSLILVH